ncbi:head-tail connector protein [Psychrobacillus psychrodurans]|uniref:head-tail connector protein n=1 Tax=Psychrobacillus psychrodurans TaxID=126157 RepID=UPI0008E1787E|nr:head-tail connector protein [Psychrobacillus psychrodurans]MCZ8541967.1 head-tail connector protein [Psychrobacillus psychrodurans]SFN13968.1 uncharacterized phage protein (possible DNA packaging) [Psychrobacillus psychrodurans]
MPLLDDVKKALRVSSTTYDDEVNDLIDAGKSDLRLAGIYFKDQTDTITIDPLIKRALITYCKANFGYENMDADRFRDSYVMLKQHLSLAGDYREPMV